MCTGFVAGTVGDTDVDATAGAELAPEGEDKDPVAVEDCLPDPEFEGEEHPETRTAVAESTSTPTRHWRRVADDIARAPANGSTRRWTWPILNGFILQGRRRLC